MGDSTADVQQPSTDRMTVRYVRISGESPVGELDGLFVEPSAMGRGVGTTLMRHATVCARKIGMERLSIDSDPHAEPFYLHAGAVRVGESESTVFPGRRLPRLELDLTSQLQAN